MRTNRNIRLIEAFTACNNMLFLIAIMIPFYRDQMGLSFSDFMLAETIFATVLLFTEVPSGWLSDVWKRKNVLILGGVFNTAGFAIITVATNLATVVTGEILLGVGMALFSGTHSAMLYDTLLSANRTHDYVRLEGRRQGAGFYSIAIASIVGGFLYSMHIQLPAALTILTALAAMGLAMLMDEPERHKRGADQHPIADMVATAKYALHGHAEIAMIIIFAAMLFSGTRAILWTQQPYYIALNIPEHMFGLLMAVGFLMAGASSHMSHWIKSYLSHNQVLALSWGIVMVSALGAAIHTQFYGIAFLMVGGSFIFGMASPHVTDAVNKMAPPARRATTLSTMSLARQVAFIPLGLSISYVSDTYGVNGALFSVAGWVAFGGICLGFVALRRRQNKNAFA